MSAGILFFADRLPPLIGGMEMHAGYFIEYFINNPSFPLISIITKNAEGKDVIINNNCQQIIDISNPPSFLNPSIVFFNSGRWIENFEHIRKKFSKAKFFYRTGGNEILKASLTFIDIPQHHLRQEYWTRILNNTIDYLITNSAYTEARLKTLGITCPFIRCVGGVNISALKSLKPINKDLNQPIVIFCAARFVKYKNHALLVSVIYKLVLRGHNIQVRLAGDGPLLNEIKEQVNNSNLNSVVEFLGALSNEQTCQEIANANIYMQLSNDVITEVPGGSYIHSEGMGRSILEALTAGTFVIAGRSGALPEIVIKDRGLLIELKDSEKIIDEIEHVLLNLPARLPLLEEYGWKYIFNRYEALFESINEDFNSYRKMQSSGSKS